MACTLTRRRRFEARILTQAYNSSSHRSQHCCEKSLLGMRLGAWLWPAGLRLSGATFSTQSTCAPSLSPPKTGARAGLPVLHGEVRRARLAPGACGEQQSGRGRMWSCPSCQQQPDDRREPRSSCASPPAPFDAECLPLAVPWGLPLAVPGACACMWRGTRPDSTSLRRLS